MSEASFKICVGISFVFHSHFLSCKTDNIYTLLVMRVSVLRKEYF
ncbi:hypothetical protein V6Z11_D08G194300 [Gossypium hirsutum]